MNLSVRTVHVSQAFYFLVVASCAHSAFGQPPSGEVPLVNQRVLQFCESHLNTKVGDGCCSTLAVKALEYAGNDVEHYKWGRLLKETEPLIPGDIIQFKNVRCLTDKDLYNFVWHTVIVKESEATGLTVYEQNVPTGHGVQLRNIPTDATWYTHAPEFYVRKYRPLETQN